MPSLGPRRAVSAVSGTDTPADTVPAQQVRLRLVPVNYFGMEAVATAEICLQTGGDEELCDQSSLEGAQLEIPKAMGSDITLLAPDFVPTLWPAQAWQADKVFVVPMFNAGLLPGAAAAGDVTLDPSMGHVLVIVSRNGNATDTFVENAHLALLGTAGDGPFYIDGNVPTRSETGTAESGAAVFFNVPPGSALMSITHSTRNCVLSGPGHASETATEGLTPVRAGLLSHVAFQCPTEKSPPSQPERK
ncbi:MAG: hypothetical protein ACI9MR_000241 [Myxococcota bacterium]|jgi:hypothetical protein